MKQTVKIFRPIRLASRSGSNPPLYSLLLTAQRAQPLDYFLACPLWLAGCWLLVPGPVSDPSRASIVSPESRVPAREDRLRFVQPLRLLSPLTQAALRARFDRFSLSPLVVVFSLSPSSLLVFIV